MKPIYIKWTGGVDEQEYGIGVSTALELYRLAYATARRRGFLPLPAEIRAFGNWMVPGIPQDAPYWSTYWYVSESYSSQTGRLVAPRYLDAIREEPWQRSHPHYDLAMTEFDLVVSEKAREDEYTLGWVLEGIGTIVSVIRVRFALEGEKRLLAIRRLVAHHLARAIRTPYAGEREFCSNVCALRPATTTEELAALALEEWQAGVLLCPQCQEELLDALLVAERPPN